MVAMVVGPQHLSPQCFSIFSPLQCGFSLCGALGPDTPQGVRAVLSSEDSKGRDARDDWRESRLDPL